MLHELLFGLLGHGLFVPPREARSAGWGDPTRGAENEEEGEQAPCPAKGRVPPFMVPDVLSEAEAALTEEIVAVGVVYRELGDYVRTFGRQGGHLLLVRRALCAGVEELLAQHRERVCEVEQLALREAHVPLSQVRHLIADSQSVLAPVLELCQAVRRRGLVGGQILETLNLALTRTGVELLRSCLERLLFHCTKPFFNAVEAWMTHGILADAAGEFFIQERAHRVLVPQEGGDSGGCSTAERALSEEPGAREGRFGFVAEYEWKSQFRVRLDRLPRSFFPLDLAEKVLFVGKAVRVLQHSRFARASQSTEGQEQAEADEDAEDERAFEAFTAVLGEARRAVPLDMLRVAKAIRRYYLGVAFRLQRLLVRDAKLIDQLAFVRDFFLLGRGAFFSSFIDIGHDLLANPPRPSLAQAEAAVNAGPWREAAVQSGMDSWPELQAAAFARLRLFLNRSSVDFGIGFVSSGSTERGDKALLQLLSEGEAGTSAAPGGERSRLSDLVLVGDCELQHGVVRVKTTPAGLWSGPKVFVERGFTSRLAFRMPHAATATGPTTVALCVHHDASVGPTALGKKDGIAELANCVAFVVAFEAGGGTARLSAQHGDKVLGEGDAGVLLADEPPGQRDKSKSGPGRPFALVVQYRMEGEERVRMVASVSLLDGQKRAVTHLKVPLDLGSTIELERGSGRAWVGALVGGHGGEDACLGAWRVNSELAADKSEDFDPWRALLTLRWRVDWPLHLVLTQTALDQYGMLFRFLLCLKRVEHALKEAWGVINQTRFKNVRGDPVQMRRLMLLWRMRASMAYLVNNLQFHLQVDVIDSLQSELVEQIRAAKDFAVVAEAHRKFMDALITRSFLHNKVVRNTIDTVLRRCLRFCGLVQKFSRYDGLPRGSEDRAARLEELDASVSGLAKSFSRDSSFLYALLTRINSNLLLRIDFNGHFSALAKGQASYSS